MKDGNQVQKLDLGMISNIREQTVIPSEILDYLAQKESIILNVLNRKKFPVTKRYRHIIEWLNILKIHKFYISEEGKNIMDWTAKVMHNILNVNSIYSATVKLREKYSCGNFRRNRDIWREN